jgi:6-phosphofructokinase
MHIGILTGGGDCPGLNAVIRAATLELLSAGARVTGIERGFLGLMRGRLRPLASTTSSTRAAPSSARTTGPTPSTTSPVAAPMSRPR